MGSTSIKTAFGRGLRRVRKAHGLSQDGLADVSGRTYVSALERGLKSPTLEKVAELAQALDIHPITLITLAFRRRGESARALLARVERELSGLEEE